MSDPQAEGFVPPPYPYDKLDRLAARCAEHPGGIVDFLIQPVNVAAFTTRGIDFTVNYLLDPADLQRAIDASEAGTERVRTALPKHAPPGSSTLMTPGKWCRMGACARFAWGSSGAARSAAGQADRR